jgi:hypothetical protein
MMAKKRHLFSELRDGMSELARIRADELSKELMNNTIEFRRFGRRRWFFCMLEDGELKLFGSAATAQAWAVTQGFRAVFVETK